MTTLYATPDESGEMTMIEVNANVTEAGWDTVAFIEAIWPGAKPTPAASAPPSTPARASAPRRWSAASSPSCGYALGDTRHRRRRPRRGDRRRDRSVRRRADRLNAALRAAQSVLDAGTEVNVHELLASRGQIALVWGVEDVQEVRPDLTDEQAWQVLQRVEHKHDATLGITWDTLEWAPRICSAPPLKPPRGGITMPLYDVTCYREMRLLFEGIEAGSHEEAAAMARRP